METKSLAVSLSFLILSLTTIAAQRFELPILDLEDNPLLLEAPYTVVPVQYYWGGGVCLPPQSFDPTCELGVTTTPSVFEGTPVVFSLPNQKAFGVVNDTTSVDIRFFDQVRDCDKSPLWQMDDSKFVVVGGAKGAQNTIFNIVSSFEWGSLPGYYLKLANSNDLMVGYRSLKGFSLDTEGIPFVFRPRMRRH